MTLTEYQAESVTLTWGGLTLRSSPDLVTWADGSRAVLYASRGTGKTNLNRELAAVYRFGLRLTVESLTPFTVDPWPAPAVEPRPARGLRAVLNK